MSEELRLPPHIENRNGNYWNSRTGRWVGAYKIKKVCDEYWSNNNLEQLTVETANGTIAYKKPKKQGKPPLLNATDLNEKLSAVGQRPVVLNKKEYQPGEESKQVSKPKVAATSGYDFAEDDEDVQQDDLDVTMLIEDDIDEDEISEERSDDRIVESVSLQETHIPLVQEDQLGESVEEIIDRFHKAKKLVEHLSATNVPAATDEPTEIPQETEKFVEAISVNQSVSSELNPQKFHIEPHICSVAEVANVIEEKWHDPESLLTIKSAAKELNHSTAYIYQLLQKGKLDEVEVDGIKFVTKESVKMRRQEYDDQNARLKAEKASEAARKTHIKKVDTVELVAPFIERIDRNSNGDKSDAKLFFESPIYQNSVSFLWNIENHDGLATILTDICKQWEIDWVYMREKVRLEKIPKFDDIWYEEIMSMACHALWTRLPIANRIDWLSGFLNRTPIQITALLGIFYREMHTKRGNWYNWKENDSAWWEWAMEFDHPLDDYFLPFYRFDYTYKYCEKKKKC